MNKKIVEIKNASPFKESHLVKTYTKEQMIDFAMLCSGHRKYMIENRFEEFEYKKIR
jgi:hypothetical protein